MLVEIHKLFKYLLIKPILQTESALYYFYVSAHKYVERMAAAATQKVQIYRVVLVHMIRLSASCLILARAKFLSKGYDDG